MKKWIFATLVFLLNLHAQSQKLTDEVHLKNGSILKGTIIENDTTALQLKTHDGSIWVFTSSELKSIKVGVQQKSFQPTNIQYVFSLSAGGLLGSSKNEHQTPLSLTMEHQVRVHQAASIGGVIGLEFLNESVMPLGLSIKGYVSLAERSELFLGCSGGYLYSLEVPYDPYEYINKNNGGTFANIELGAIFASNSRTRFFIAAGYRYAELHYTLTDYYWLPDKRDMYFDRFNLRFGFWIQ